jgi:hypothetical protein
MNERMDQRGVIVSTVVTKCNLAPFHFDALDPGSNDQDAGQSKTVRLELATHRTNGFVYVWTRRHMVLFTVKKIC